MGDFRNADQGLHGADEGDETPCPDCGGLHDHGLGDGFTQFVAMAGIDHPAVRAALESVLIDKGVETSVLDALSEDALTSLIAEVAVPVPERKIGDWGLSEQGENQSSSPAFLASGYFASRILSSVEDIAVTIAAITNRNDLGMHPYHIGILLEAFERAEDAVIETGVWSPNPLQPEPNVDLSRMAEADPVRTSRKVVTVTDEFAAYVASAERVEFDRIQVIDDRIEELVAKGLTEGEATMQSLGEAREAMAVEKAEATVSA